MREQEIRNTGLPGWISTAGSEAAEAMSASGTKRTSSSRATMRLYTAACLRMASVRRADLLPQQETEKPRVPA